MNSCLTKCLEHLKISIYLQFLSILFVPPNYPAILQYFYLLDFWVLLLFSNKSCFRAALREPTNPPSLFLPLQCHFYQLRHQPFFSRIPKLDLIPNLLLVSSRLSIVVPASLSKPHVVLVTFYSIFASLSLIVVLEESLSKVRESQMSKLNYFLEESCDNLRE